MHAEAALERDARPDKGLPQEHPTCMHTLVGCGAKLRMPALMRNFSCNNCIQGCQPSVLGHPRVPIACSGSPVLAIWSSEGKCPARAMKRLLNRQNCKVLGGLPNHFPNLRSGIPTLGSHTPPQPGVHNIGEGWVRLPDVHEHSTALNAHLCYARACKHGSLLCKGCALQKHLLCKGCALVVHRGWIVETCGVHASQHTRALCMRAWGWCRTRLVDLPEGNRCRIPPVGRTCNPSIRAKVVYRHAFTNRGYRVGRYCAPSFACGHANSCKVLSAERDPKGPSQTLPLVREAPEYLRFEWLKRGIGGSPVCITPSVWADHSALAPLGEG